MILECGHFIYRQNVPRILNSITVFSYLVS